jgi:alpha-tubulin suppressor-like RCC1 family protein
MKRRASYNRLAIPAFLVISLACSLFASPPKQTSPTSSIYATAITVGGVHACALLNNNTVVCWGDNSAGQLGNGSYVQHNTAVQVLALEDVIAIAAGGEHTCALTMDGGMKCWGDNRYGQIGDGTRKSSTTPVEVTGLSSGAIAISAGMDHTCAIMSTGQAKCWGANLYGRLGGDLDGRLVDLPTNVVGGTDVSAIFAGAEHTCAITADRRVKCWGQNTNGELGDGTDRLIRNTPVDVIGISDVATMTTGFSNTCAVSEGDIYCWGMVPNNGRYEFTNIPIAIQAPGEEIVKVASGARHICGVSNRGAVLCWGENETGQLGDGSTRQTARIVDVPGFTNAVTEIAASYHCTCALTTAGEVLCWGDNSAGQLGNGTTENSAVPVDVVGIIK